MPRKILVVDDNIINRQMLIHTLKSDYDIIEAENGKDALALMHRGYKILSAVLLDIKMPEMDGYELLSCVRENVQLSQIPIIVVTGSEDEASRVKALSLGANDFILKPFNPEIVRHCLRNNIALRETASILNAIQKDKLTGLFNREAFFEKVNGMIRDKEPGYYYLSCFDIDNFKLVNDQYGAAEGDRILRLIGGEVRENMETLRGIGARISADNFAALFPKEASNDTVLQKIHDKSFTPISQQTIVFSIGRYLVTDTSLSASSIYDRAYIAKQSIKGRYDKHIAYFDENMLEKLVQDQQIIGEMENALYSKQFEVWFQPQYNHACGTLIGAEALVRWRHPTKGIVSPAKFIPLFEQNGFIYELDKFVWREVCGYLRKWIDLGMNPVPVSVNISRYDIFRADLIDVLMSYIKEFNIPVGLLRLEITESAFTTSTKLIVEIVEKFTKLGFVVEIDDFGSGYSSLNTLKSVPAQIVKLDMRFLEDDEKSSQRGGNIIESIVRMTKWLGMSVLAEGVETKEQGDFLKSIGCSQVQGYLYARPMPAADYELYCKTAETEKMFISLETVDNLDNNMFWNPKSMETLIFNSYVGAACLFEYHAGEIEMLRVNDRYVSMLGSSDYTVEDILKIDFLAHVSDESRALTVAAVEKSAQDNKEITGEFIFLDLPNCPHETYLRSTIRVIATVGDRFLVYCISENITAQRLSEKKEQLVARKLQVIMDKIGCGITAVAELEQKSILANNKFYELLGYTRNQYDDEIGKDVFSRVYPEDKGIFHEIVRNVAENQEPVLVEYRALCRDGHVIWLRSYISKTYVEEIHEKVLLCTYSDVTYEKHIAQDLLDNIPCGAGMCKITENSARMLYLNKRYYSYFKNHSGIDRAASFYDVVHPDDREVLRKALSPALLCGSEGSCVIRILDGTDEYIKFRLHGASMESNGDGATIYVTFVPVV